MLGPLDYVIIGFLVVVCLIAAYFRRDKDNKKRIYLSYSLLISACLSVVGYFFLFYIIGNYDKYLIIHLLLTILILIVSILLTLYKLKIEKNEE